MKNSVLFGNGLNNLSKNRIPWDELLNKIKGISNFDNGTLPNTFIYERAIFENHLSDNIRETEYEIKKSISELLSTIETNDFYRLLFELNCENYLTTNYDYAFKNYILKTEEYLIENHSTEDIYSIRRQTQVFNKEQEEILKIWHIHGEISNPISIMLGLDHYCGSVSKLDAYVKGTYDFQENSKKINVKKMSDKLLQGAFDSRSWSDLLFNSNIHIIGLSLDFSETDIWWVLTKRARMIKDKKTSDLIKNKIYFYDKNIKEDKEELLDSLGVSVVKPTKEYGENWSEYYLDTINDIKEKIEATKIAGN
jgi:hypothetical protein